MSQKILKINSSQALDPSNSREGRPQQRNRNSLEPTQPPSLKIKCKALYNQETSSKTPLQEFENGGNKKINQSVKQKFFAKYKQENNMIFARSPSPSASSKRGVQLTNQAALPQSSRRSVIVIKKEAINRREQHKQMPVLASQNSMRSQFSQRRLEDGKVGRQPASAFAVYGTDNPRVNHQRYQNYLNTDSNGCSPIQCMRMSAQSSKEHFQIDTNQEMPVQLLTESDECDFERQLSDFVLSQESHRKDSHGQKKFVISKEKVNFLSPTANLIDRKLTLNHCFQDFERRVSESNAYLSGPSQSHSPPVRRLKSDNQIASKPALKHERSQNYLSLHTKNKLEVPRVIKANPQAASNQAAQSPACSFQRMQSLQVRPRNALLPSTQSNAEQLPSSQRYITGSRKQEAKQQILHNKSTASREENVRSNNHSKERSQQDSSRVPQSLLLDNYLVKSRSSSQQRNNEPLRVEVLQNNKTADGQMKNKEAMLIINEQQATNEIGSPLSFNYSKNQRRKSALSSKIQQLSEEYQRSNTPVRVSEYLVDIDFLKAKASERITDQGSPPTQGSNTKAGQLMSASTSSSNAIVNLSHANTTEKFKEIIDNLFVPTVTTYRKSAKEKVFRRPTQNPSKKSMSFSRSQARTDSQKAFLASKLST